MAGASARKCVILVNAVNLSTYFTRWSAPRLLGAGKGTGFGVDDESYVATIRSGSISLAGLGDAAGASGATAVFNAAFAAGVDTYITLYPFGYGLGNLAIYGLSLQNKWSPPSANYDGILATAAECNTDGAHELRGVCLQDATSLTGTGTGTSVNTGETTTNGGVMQTNVLANTSAGATLLTEHSADNNTFVTLASQSIGAAATGGFRTVVAAGTTVNPYLRRNLSTLTGGAITAPFAFARH